MIEITPEEIAQNYSAAMDSVNLIATLKAKAVLTDEDIDCMSRNKRHLEIMIAKDYWTDEDLTPFTLAVGD